MAIIPDSTKIDKAFKFIGGKAYTTDQKGIDNEDAASGFIVGTNTILAQDINIPTTAPGTSTSILTFYGPTSRFKMIEDVASPTNKAWYASTNGANLVTMRSSRVPNWIPPTLGNYTIRIFLTNGSSTSATPVQEIFFSDPTSPLFDYKTGILTFESDPLATYSSIIPTPDGIQISGYIYIGAFISQNFDDDGYVAARSLTDFNNASASFDANGPLVVASPDAYGSDWTSEDITFPLGNSGGHAWAGTWQAPNGMTIMVGTAGGGGNRFFFQRSYADGYWHSFDRGSSGVVTAVWGADNSNIFATSTSSLHVVLKSSDGGVSWQDIIGASLNNANAIWGSSIDDIYIFGNDGYIAHSKDTGLNFQQSGTWTDFTSVFSNTVGSVMYTLLADGRIFKLADQATQAQIFDPVTDTVFNTSATIDTPVTGASLVSLPGNKVAIIGGLDGGLNPLDTIQIYNIGGDSWTTSAATLSEAKFNAASVILTIGSNSGKVLVTGGEVDNSYGATNSCDFYDPVGDSVTAAASLSFAGSRSQHTLVTLQDGYVVAIGGQVLDSVTATGPLDPRTIELYNPIGNSWSDWPTPLTAGRVLHSSILLNNGKVLIVGGNGNTPSVPNSINTYYVYDDDGTLNTSGTINTARRQFGIVVLSGGSVLISGGTDVSNLATATAEIYTFDNDTFSSTTSMNNALEMNYLSLIVSGPNINDAATINNSGFVAERFTPGQLNSDINDLYGAWGSDANNIYAVGDNGTIIHSDGYGTWMPQTSGTANKLRGIFGNSAEDIYVVGDSGTILHSMGDGYWTDQSISSVNTLYGIWSTILGGSRYYAVGQDGTGATSGVIYVSSGDGVWTLVNSRIHSTFQSVFGGLAGVYVSDTNTIDGEMPQRLPATPVLDTVGELFVESNLTAGSSITTQAVYVKNNIIISDGYGFISTAHIVSQGETPQIIGDTGAGSGGAFAIAVTGTDTAGEIVLTTGNGVAPATTAVIFTLSYSVVYPSDVDTYIMITPSNLNAGAFVGGYVTSDFQSFSLNSGAIALTGNIQYKWQYHVVSVGEV